MSTTIRPNAYSLVVLHGPVTNLAVYLLTVAPAQLYICKSGLPESPQLD